MTKQELVHSESNLYGNIDISELDFGGFKKIINIASKEGDI